MEATIRELIITLKGTRTYEQLAEDCGGVPTSGRIQQLATKPQNTFPSPDTVRGLSRGLGVNPMTLLAACAKSFGLPTEGAPSRLSTMLPPGVEALDDGQLRATLAVVSQFVACNVRESELAAAGRQTPGESEQA